MARKDNWDGNGSAGGEAGAGPGGESSRRASLGSSTFVKSLVQLLLLAAAGAGLAVAMIETDSGLLPRDYKPSSGKTKEVK